MNKPFLLPLALLTALAIPTQALAHSVETNYLVDINKQLELETVFSTGEPLQGATVRVYAPGNSQTPWLEGKTDENGKFTFKPDSKIPGDWEVSIKDQGHADILTVPVDDKGVEVDEISEAMGVHMHYATGPLAAFGTLIVGGVWVFKRRRQSPKV